MFKTPQALADWLTSLDGRNLMRTPVDFTEFAHRVMRDHRTIQQQVIGILFRMLYALSNVAPEYGHDLRNEASHEALAKFHEAVVNDDINITFPYL